MFHYVSGALVLFCIKIAFFYTYTNNIDNHIFSNIPQDLLQFFQPELILVKNV